jgi:hypothetical protein
MSNNSDFRLNGLNPLSYMGVNPRTPVPFFSRPTDPTPTDYANFILGTIWLNTTSEAIWMLVAKAAQVSTWVMISTGSAGTVTELTGNSGGPVLPLAGNINVVGDGVGISIVGNPTTHTLTASLVGGGQAAQQFPTDSGTAIPIAGVLNIKSGTATLNSGSSVSTSGSSNIVLLNVTDTNSNTLVGNNAGNLTLSGSNNTSLGKSSLHDLTTANANTVVGSLSGSLITTGNNNTIVGEGSGTLLTTGAANLIIGQSSGNALMGSESNNLLINHAGIVGASNWIIIANGVPNRFITTDMVDNQFIGIHAGNISLTGTNNTVFGANSLNLVTTSSGNTIVGNSVMTTATSGANENTIVGSGAYHLGADSNNTIIGSNALFTATSASTNTIIGASAGYDSVAGLGLTTGDMNILIGYTSASAYRGNESNNVIIDNGTGIAVAGESNKTKISGIRGATTTNNNAVAVLIDSAGQLGTVSSSIRLKENVNDMGEISSPIMSLRPVTFNYKERSANEIQVGLIAEEVNKVMPNLVAHDNEGEIFSVKYHDLPVLLLNELQILEKN